MDKTPKVVRIKDDKLHLDIKMQALREGMSVEKLAEKVFRSYLRSKNRTEKAAA